MTTAIDAITTIPLTMSSREIAELTGKRHDNVISDIEKMLNDVGEDALKFEGIYLDAYKREKKCYNLPKNLTLNLVTGYRADMRLKIIDRWLELEDRPQPKHEIPQTLGEALRLAAAENDMRLAAESKVAALTPKAEALDRISTADGTYGLYEAAKILQVKPQKLVQWMGSNRWIYKRTGSKNWLARQEKIDAGYLWHKVRTYTDANGEEKTRDEVKVLPKGLTKLAQVVSGAFIDLGIAPEKGEQTTLEIMRNCLRFLDDRAAGRMSSNDIMDGVARASAVWAKMDRDPREANIGNCKRSLIKAAHAITQLWDDVLEEEQRRKSGQKALA